MKLFHTWTSHRPPSDLSKRTIVASVLKFRLWVYMCMSMSWLIIPDHNPGNDVLRFELRLSDPIPCFCLSEHACSAWTSTECPTSDFHASHYVPTSLWKFFLEPLTRWDAARFLHLACRTALRDPPIGCQRGELNSCDFSDSEQAHAFFPLFPSLLRMGALSLLRLLPSSFLPPTFECLVVLTGILINLFCLVVGTMALYSLTMSILPASLELERKQQLATSACLVYGISNPATVFFATNYSESLFSTLTILGHAIYAQDKALLAIPLWMLASFARSNGSIHSLWLLVQSVGHMCHHIASRKPSKGKNQRQSIFVKVLFLVSGSILVILPIRHHDWKGYARHCQTDSPIKPSWCGESSQWFSLYGWTQRRHWNVGFFRYYEFKQLPNFLLAAPILGLSTWGVISWIYYSMLKYGKGKLPSAASMVLLDWPLRALADSVENSSMKPSTGSTHYQYLIDNPKLLGHYLLLAGLTVVGLVVAHVQISTRMILSSSPAAIWLLTYCHLQEQSLLLRRFVTIYTMLFIGLGILLHVNFLPWT